MTARSNRTFICSVLFLDIIGYSRKPVSEQIWLKDRFNSLLSEALGAVAPGDRIILDTGDGAAVSFLGDPEEALFCALSLRDALEAPQPANGPQISMRIGINLGPVKLVKDINGQPNIIGDGINVAQRVMSFSEPCQILVSRSYYEVVSCLSDAYAELFRFEGSRTDKHVREHEVYAVGTAAVQRPAIRTGQSAPGGGPVIDQLAQTATRFKDSLRRKPRLGTALAVIAILVTALVVRGTRDEPQQMNTTEAATDKATPSQPAKSAPPGADSAAPPATNITAKPAEQERAMASLSVLPWGEIYVDGRKVGVSPPLHEIEIKPGKAEQNLATGIRQYEEHNYSEAARSLQASLDAGLASKSDQIKAHKHLAFIHCVSARERQCRDEFRKILKIDPAFELDSAEAGHPNWGPAFRSAKGRR